MKRTGVKGSRPPSERATDLFKYLKALVELRAKVVRQVEEYEEVIWLAHVPAELECVTSLSEGNDLDGAWLRVDRPHIPDTPAPPSSCRPYLGGSQIDDWANEPVLSPVVQLGTEAERTEENRVEPPLEVVAAFENYLRQEWRPWAAILKRIAPVKELYGRLFRIAQQQERLSENYEVVLGLGLLSIDSGGPAVRRHLIAARAEVALDKDLGTITVGQPPTGASPRLEKEMLEVSQRPSGQQVYDLEKEVASLEDVMADGTHVLLRRWANLMGDDAAYEREMEPQQHALGRPLVRVAPAIILRKRNQNSTLAMFDEIVAQLEAEGTLTEAVSVLLGNEVAEGDRSSFYGDASDKDTVDEEIYFPLPANEEQRQIVHRLRRSNGILVQGPPGTGKSHTIANLIAHYLAQGKRLLVTSHTARALKVLKSKIPAELQPLCVNLLGADREAITELELSVQGITDKQQLRNPSAEKGRITRYQSLLDEARREQAKLSKELLELREAETVTHTIAGYEGTASQVAEALARDRDRYEWFRDRAAGDASPLSAQDGREVLEALTQLGIEPDTRRLITIEKVAVPEDFRRLVRDEESIKARLHAADSQVAQRWLEASDGRWEKLSQAARTLAFATQALRSNRRLWIPEAIEKVLAAESHLYVSLARALSNGLLALDGRVSSAHRHSIDGLEQIGRGEAKRLANELRAHLTAGGQLKRGPVRTKAAKQARPLTDFIRVDGRPPVDEETLALLLERIDVEESLESLEQALGDAYQTQTRGLIQREAALRAESATFSQLLELDDLNSSFRKEAEKCPGIPVPNTPERLNQFVATLDIADALRRRASVQEQFDALLRSVRAVSTRADTHPVVAELLESIEQRDIGSYEAALSRLEEAWQRQMLIRKRDEWLDYLQDHLPLLKSELIATIELRDVWTSRFDDIDRAWAWRQAEQWLTALVKPGRERELSDSLEVAEAKERRALAQLASAKAWQMTLESLTSREAQHLKNWAFAVRRLGKGTGKYAGKWRAEARQSMQECRTAIPVWIMPTYQVATNVDPVPGAFDVVIVDEASQSGVEALFLMYLGKQVIIVGDDQQISPDSVGIDRAQVAALESQYLADIPFPKTLSLESSLFSRAEVQFGDVIRLREHFRCMPEIIQFSNQLCYRGLPLTPLRQYGLDRLDPIITRYVEDGYRVGEGASVLNPPEAEAIAEAIEKCCADPAYDGLTFGVISLQSSRQAMRIQELLLNRLGHKEFMERRIVCGDAYAFQGDERDVIMLSLVAAPGKTRIGPLAKEADKRRFNVAASRAKDQVWLFHSVRHSELSQTDLRRTLLEYFLRPNVADQDEFDLDLANDRISERFESIFEQRVFEKIRDRGYRVRPQVSVADYRIDLVVEGMRGRLAVECDGDSWHGPERWAEDDARQRQLERCGWTFWRVRGSEFFADPDGSLTSLWEVLEELGIYPRSQGRSEPVEEIDNSLVADLASGMSGDASWEAEDDSSPEQEEPSLSGAPVKTTMGTSDEDSDHDEEPRNFDLTPRQERLTRSTHSGVRPRLMSYANWSPRWLPDPGEASKKDLEQAMIEIIEAEGPILGRRAYALIAKAASRQRVTKLVIRTLNPIAHALTRAGRIVAEDEWNTDGQQDKVLRPPGSDVVLLRERGQRELYEIPPLEVATLMNGLCSRRPAISKEELWRATLESYGLVRLTEKVEEFLAYAESLRKDPRLPR